MVDGDRVDRLSVRQIGRAGAAALVRQIRADGNLHGPEGRARTEAALVPVALYRGPDDGGSHPRAHVSRNRRLRPSDGEAARRAAAACGAVEVRLQVD